MEVIGKRLEASGGIGKGFDALRLILAVGVVGWHANSMVRGGLWLDHTRFAWFPGYAILSMFFALSGFLIAGSARRLRLPDFLLNRGLRIFPALAVEILLSAFVLGLAVTTLPAATYLTRGQTWHYLTNIVALINYELPGVFKTNANDIVNGSLWTVPLEFLCYAVMAVIMLTSMLKRPVTILILSAALICVGLIAQLAAPPLMDGTAAFMGAGLFEKIFTAHQSRLLISFLLGIILFCYKDRIPYSKTYAAIAVATCVLVSFAGYPQQIGYPLLNLIAAPALAYLMVFVGVSNVPTPAVFKKGDYSYGIYLYGYPLQQLAASNFPGVHSAVLQFFIALPLIALFSIFSWHFIEKPILRMRKHFSFISRARLAEDAEANAAPKTAALQS
ncbi:MAG: acyltransferase [Burkholderiaceae bacterium]